ncbi:MAG: MMPL family transporter, partial [Desulfobacteraceae bacterium]|nr:MMPL family transporter [Desulfobacteraceae bacterium]
MTRLSKAINTRNWLRFIVDHPLQVIILLFLVTLLFASQIPKLHFRTSIYDMAIEDLTETLRYESFKKDFGTEEIILVVAKAKNIFEKDTFQQIRHLSEKFSKIGGVRRVISLPFIKKDMDATGKWSLADFEEIIVPIDLFPRNLISTDKKTTVITLILEDTKENDQVIDAAKAIIDEQKRGLSLYQIGMPLVSRALATYTQQDFIRLPPITFLVIACVLFFFFRNLRGILIPVGSVLIALIWTFGLMGFTRTPLAMLTMIVPIFLIAVGTAYCMYIFPEYFAQIERTDSRKEASYQCFLRIGFPTTLAVITTSIGLGSLLLNRISAIREFAIFSCFGIWSMLIIMLVFLPAVFALLPFPQKKARRRLLEKGLLYGLLQKIIQLNLHYQKVTLPIITLIAIVGLVGIFQIRVETNPVGFFKKDTAISQHFHDIYKDMAGSFPINLVLDSRTEDYFENPEHLMEIVRVQDFLNTLQGVDKTISFGDYLKLVNYSSNQYEQKYYAMPEEPFEVRMLMNSYKTMLGQDTFERFMAQDLSKVNILLRTHISSSRDFLRIKKTIEDRLRGTFPKDFGFQVTGFGIVISESSHILTEGQVKSLTLTLVLIFGIMFLFFLSGKVGLIAIVPNCFPIIVNFGLMGWLGIELSVATSLVASIAIGLAVDDTIHYLVRYNREFKKDLDKKRALQDTIQNVARPIIFTTFTIGLGFAILIFSHFKPTAVFGLMMVITMASALVGDLIILPSLMTHVELVTLWDLLRLKLGKDPEKGIPLFSGLSSTQVHYILLAGTLRTYEKGEVLFRKGEPSDSMFAIISGELEVLDTLDDTDPEGIHGNKKFIRTLGVGDVVGEMGMVRSSERSATVIATTLTEMLQINDRMIKRLQWLYPPTAQKFFFNLMSIICDKLEFTTQCLSDVTTADPLTGLQNRDFFMNVLEKEVARSKRYHTDLSLFLMDLDNFKGINVTYGRETGDRILWEVGQFVLKHVRSSDQACRYGEQQIAVMLVNSPLAEAQT